MLLERNLLDQKIIETVVDREVQIYDVKSMDLLSVSKNMTDRHQRFIIVTNQSLCAILTAYDLLSIHVSNTNIKGYIDANDKWVQPLLNNMSIKSFLVQYEHQVHRYYPVIDQSVIGFIDKKSILSLYKKIDEENYLLITSILDNINDAVCIADTNCRVKFWNKNAEKLYGISREKILDQVLTDHFPNALLPKVIKEEAKVINVYNSPRENCHNLITASPLYNQGVLIGAISYDKDISEQFKIAEDLKAKETDLQALKRELVKLGEERYTFENMVGEDPSWTEIIKLSKMVAKSMINILIGGESGTGKEVLARAIHKESRRQGNFVPINCSAIPKDLFESELFGYKSGAFSGASQKGKMGQFEFANQGTLFLDEIGDMPLEMQAKLLRVLEDNQVTPVGSNKSIAVDVRVIAASNKDLLELSNQGLFRKDLYYRLNGIMLQLSPLRDRPGDIRLLTRKYFDDFRQQYGCKELILPEELIKLLESYHWEGNIRELKNIVERLVILSKNNDLDLVSEKFLPDVIRNMAIRMKVGPTYSLTDLLEKTEKEAIVAALSKSKSKADAAKLLKIPRSTLYFKMDKYGLKHTSEN